MALLLEVQERLKTSKREEYITHEEVLTKYGISKEELEGIEVEFE